MRAKTDGLMDRWIYVQPKTNILAKVASPGQKKKRSIEGEERV